MKAAELLVRCLENEGVEVIFGIPGEENVDILDVLPDSKIRFIVTRHEQAAAFIADVYGRLTGRAGVCLTTLGPGATNLVTGVADANLDHAPLVAISGQSATTRIHKETHQHLDLVEPLPADLQVCRASDRAGNHSRSRPQSLQTSRRREKPGVSFIDLPENIAQMDVQGKTPLPVPIRPADRFAGHHRSRGRIIREAKYPLLMAGNGVIRAGPSDALRQFAEKLNIPVANTFMAKGVVPFSHPLWLGAVGLQARDYVSCGFDRADVIVSVGYDMVEYHPNRWNPTRTSRSSTSTWRRPRWTNPTSPTWKWWAPSARR